jgi:hypothetical protein
MGTLTFVVLGFLFMNYRESRQERSAYAPPPPPPPKREQPSNRIHALEQRLTKATAEAESWKRRAVAAETRANDLAAAQPAQLAPDHRFRQLRALLARELHPDHTKADGIERIIRSELFKSLWPEVEKIEQTAQR